MKSYLQKTYRKGFTFVELVIVISLIALFAVLVFLAFSGETSNARNVKRASDLKVLENSIAMSNAKDRNINYGTKTGPGPENAIQTNNGYLGAIRGAKIVEVDENIFDGTILPKIPRDPKGSKYIASFLNDTLYQLVAVKEHTQTGISSPFIKGTFKETLI